MKKFEKILGRLKKTYYFCGVILNYDTMIRINDLSFDYRRRNYVFEHLNLELPEGRICGLLGSNGAGKSTLLYLITGLLRPVTGNVEIDGRQVSKREVELLRDMFLVPEEFDLPSMRLMDYVNHIRGFYPSFDEGLLTECLQGFGLSTDLHLGRLSMGQKKKAYISIALACNTKYLLMDEPTNGLDIPGKAEFRKVVAMGMTDNKTLIISTHQVHDVEKLLDYLVVIEQSQILYNAPLEETDDEPLNLEKIYLDIVNGKANTQSGYYSLNLEKIYQDTVKGEKQ